MHSGYAYCDVTVRARPVTQMIAPRVILEIPPSPLLAR